MVKTRFYINRLVKYFIVSDLVLFSGWGLISPIFSVFIVEQIPGASLVNVGIVTGMYWVIRSVTEIPLANFLDKVRGEKDDFFSLVTGLLLAAVAAFGLTLVKTVNQLYFVEAIHAIAMSFYAPSWAGMFSRHLDKDRMAISWSFDHTAIGIASGVAGYLGSVMAADFGYNSIFLTAGVLSLIAAVIIFFVPDLIIPRPKRASAFNIRDHSAKISQ